MKKIILVVNIFIFNSMISCGNKKVDHFVGVKKIESSKIVLNELLSDQLILSCKQVAKMNNKKYKLFVSCHKKNNETKSNNTSNPRLGITVTQSDIDNSQVKKKNQICVFEYLDHPGIYKIRVSYKPIPIKNTADNQNKKKNKGMNTLISNNYNITTKSTVNNENILKVRKTQDGVTNLIVYNKVNHTLVLEQKRSSGPRQNISITNKYTDCIN